MNPYQPEGNTNNYVCTLYADYNPEPEIDIDEFECILQQLKAISDGWGHDFGQPFIKEEEEIENMYTWEKI